jgi:outer membrane protein assembly factor BamD (BamD/ComL family)
MLSSCATRKRKEDVSGFKKFYHNMTAKYNGYFNADVIMKETYASLEANHTDNYTEILPVYTYGSAETAKSSEGELDRAIEKVTTVATLHDVSDWVDDCYVLMGQAQYLKQDFESAEETFEYFQEEFNPNDPSSRNYKKKTLSADDKRKIREEERKEDQKIKEEERKQKAKEREEVQKEREQERKDKEDERERIKKEREQKLKDRQNRSKNRKRTPVKKDTTTTTTTSPPTTNVNTTPVVPQPQVVTVAQEEDLPRERKPEKVETENTAYHEGLLWLAKTYAERERYSSAEFLLKRMYNDPTVKEEVKKEIPAAQAHLAIKQKKYGDAQNYLELASEMSDRKKDRARYAYILAQLREKDGDYQGASEAYQRSKKLGSDYEMELNAELNIIKNNVLASNTSFAVAEEKLIGIRKQNKNEEYRDRITMIIAEIAEGSGDTETAKSYLKEALTFNTGNDVIRAESYYKIAGMAYASENYIEAKNYYDSTLTVMSKSDLRYDEAGKLANNLRDISRNLEVINIQDSLLRMGLLPKEQQIEIAQEILKQREDKKQVVAQTNEPINSVKFSRKRTLAESKFFAYNPLDVEKGKKAFEDRWGNRSLQDNWRRSSTLRSSFGNENEAEVEEVAEEEVNDEELQKILDEFPSDPSQISRVEGRIEQALFDLGKLYRDKLDNYAKAIDAHEELLSRFPDTQQKLDTYYYLYLSYIDMNRQSEANKYKNKIISEFPDTKYAMALSDPNYTNDIAREKLQLSEYYDQTFAFFENGNYQRTAAMIEESESRFGQDHELRPKFALLSAMTIGNLEGEEKYIAALQDVITRYPNTPEQTRAREVLRFLKGDENAFETIGIEEVDDIFEEENEKLHYLAVIVFDPDEEQFNDTKISISNYNKDKHRLKKLQLADIGLNKTENSKIILIRKFKGKDKAMEYYNDIIKNAKDFVNLAGVNYEVYPVTQRNYRKIIDQKSAHKYRIWFESKYLKK